MAPFTKWKKTELKQLSQDYTVSKVRKWGSVLTLNSLLFLLCYAEFSTVLHIPVFKVYMLWAYLLKPGLPLLLCILSRKMVNIPPGKAIFLLRSTAKTQIPKSYGKPFLLAIAHTCRFYGNGWYIFSRRKAGDGRVSFTEAANMATSIWKRCILSQEQVYGIAVPNLEPNSPKSN